MDPAEVERARRETPGASRVTHFNNAGAALPPDPVVQAQLDHLRLEAEIGGYEAAESAKGALQSTYDRVAEFIGCGADEIALVDSATTAWDLAFYGLPLRAGQRILTSEVEYASNFIAYLHAARRVGCEIDVVPSDEHGQIDVSALAERVDERTGLIALTHIPTNSGLINPAEEVGRVARRAGVPYLLDACQSVGQIPVDVESIGCDFLSATGRKYLRGPRGTGFLYVRRSALARLDPPRLDLTSASWRDRDHYDLAPGARRFELFERNAAAVAGLSEALAYALRLGGRAIGDRVAALGAEIREKLAEIPAVTVCDPGERRGGIVSFVVRGESADAVRDGLRARGINTSISGRSSTLLDMERRGLESVVRASAHYYNTSAEIDTLCAAVRELSHSA